MVARQPRKIRTVEVGGKLVR